jgi:hypothetical protein
VIDGFCGATVIEAEADVLANAASSRAVEEAGHGGSPSVGTALNLLQPARTSTTKEFWRSAARLAVADRAQRLLSVPLQTAGRQRSTMARWQWMAAGVALATVVALAATWWETPLHTLAEPAGPAPTPLAWTAQIEPLAGDGHPGDRDGASAQARFADPYALLRSADGSVYFTDAGDNNRIRRRLPDGRVETVAGQGEGASMARHCRPVSIRLRALPPTRRATCMWPTPATMRSAASAPMAR